MGNVCVCRAGGQLHGPYDPEGDTATIAEDFLTFCLLAVRTGVIPKRWDWAAFLQVAKRFVVCVAPAAAAQPRETHSYPCCRPFPGCASLPSDARVGTRNASKRKM